MTAVITKIIDAGVAPVKVKEGREYTLGRIILYVSINDAAPIPIMGYTHPTRHAPTYEYLNKMQWAITQIKNKEEET